MAALQPATTAKRGKKAHYDVVEVMDGPRAANYLANLKHNEEFGQRKGNLAPGEGGRATRLLHCGFRDCPAKWMMEFFSDPGAAEGVFAKVVLKKAAIDHVHNGELRRIVGIKPEIKAELLAVAAVSNRHRGKGLFEAFKFQQEENKKAGKPYFDEADYPSIDQINNFMHHNNVVTGKENGTTKGDFEKFCRDNRRKPGQGIDEPCVLEWEVTEVPADDTEVPTLKVRFVMSTPRLLSLVFENSVKCVNETLTFGVTNITFTPLIPAWSIR